MNVTYYSTKTCTPCKTLWPRVQALCATDGVPLVRVDVEEQRALAPNWITSVPTVVVKHQDGFEEVLTGQFATAQTIRKSIRRNQ